MSARNAGIPTERITILLFVTSSVSASFVPGLSQAILFNSAQVSSGSSFIFNSIISVVVGGVLLTGRYGSIIGIVMGTVTFAIVNQGIYFTSFDANLASLIIGVLMLIAVLLNNTFRKMAPVLQQQEEVRMRHVDSIVKLSNISKSFGPIDVLHNISLEVNAGEVLCLLGDNGAGKST